MTAPRRRAAAALTALRRATGSDGLRDTPIGWSVWPTGCPVCGGALIAADDLLPTCTMGDGCRQEAILARLHSHADELAQAHCRFAPEDILGAARRLHELDEHRERPEDPPAAWEELGAAERWRHFLAARDAIDRLHAEPARVSG